MAAKHEKEEQEKKIKVDGMEVKVKTPPPRKVRPVYYCQTCDTSFPSQLDLEEHKKIDHNNNNSNKKIVQSKFFHIVF
jgi:hypothetical protein